MSTWSCCGEVDDGPYVGRPIIQTDVCVSLRVDAHGAADGAVRLARRVPLEPGTVDLGDGWVQETVEVNGSRR